MVVIVLPKFVIELQDKLDKVIKDISIKNHIDLSMVDDSIAIKNAKESIGAVLVRIYKNYAVEERKQIEVFEKDMKKILKKEEKNEKEK